MKKGNIFCTCGDNACPLHPTNHDKGCTPCVAKNLKNREIPSCFFKALNASEKPTGYTFEDFAEWVSKQSNK